MAQDANKSDPMNFIYAITQLLSSSDDNIEWWDEIREKVEIGYIDKLTCTSCGFGKCGWLLIN